MKCLSAASWIFLFVFSFPNLFFGLPHGTGTIREEQPCKCDDFGGMAGAGGLIWDSTKSQLTLLDLIHPRMVKKFVCLLDGTWHERTPGAAV